MQPVLGIGSGGLPPGVDMPSSDPREMDGTFNPSGGAPGLGGKGGMPGAVIEQPMIPPGSGAPGLGGKGGGGPLAQIPIDMQGNVLGGGGNFPGAVIEQPMIPPGSDVPSMAGLPPAPNAQVPLGKVSGGTLGRPSASAPMTPRGPGFNNPGAPGAPLPQPPERGMLTPPQGQNMPFQGGIQNRLQPARPAPAVRPANPYRPAPTVARPVSITRRGAGRGGVLR